MTCAWWTNEEGEPMVSPEGIRAEELADFDPPDPDEREDGTIWDADELEDEPTYAITRFYADRELERETIATGLTLEEAQEHCHDPETSSTTATSTEAMLRTEVCGPWFDGYGEE